MIGGAWLVLLMGAFLLLPGIPASLLAFRAGQVSPVTRAAAVFGLGFTTAAGLAFVLAASHLFYPVAYIALWVVMTALLWLAVAFRRPRGQPLKGLWQELVTSPDRLALLIGAGVVIAVVIVHLPFLHYLGATRYIYYLNGLEIANAHGVPAHTLEYGHSWPPATDKIVLDSFTGVLAMLGHNPAASLGVLDVLSVLGTALGYWALAWELGLRRTGPLMPLLMLASWHKIPGMGITVVFWEYRAEDFGRAVAFCAIALGIHAFRRRERGAAVAAGLVLAAGSGAHLIPVVAAVLALSVAALGEIVRSLLPPLRARRAAAAHRGGARAAMSPARHRGLLAPATDGNGPAALALAAPGEAAVYGASAAGPGGRAPYGGGQPVAPVPPAPRGRSAAAARSASPGGPRSPGGRSGPSRHVSTWTVFSQGLIMAGLLGALFIAIRLAAGGSFGLSGASNPAGYSGISTAFDPTAYLFGAGIQPRLHAPHHWYSPGQVVTMMTSVSQHTFALSTVGVVFAAALVVALALLLFARGALRISALVGLGLASGVIAIALGFDLHYEIWLDATFGVRRLGEYVSFGFALIGLSLAEVLVLTIGRRRWLRGGLALCLAISLGAWLLPGSNGWSINRPVSQSRMRFFDWVRTDTSCGARFLVNQRTEGAFTALTGRYALLEGMGSFLRVRTMSYVVGLMLSARNFFQFPLENKAFLRRHRISYVVLARRPTVLGYSGPTGTVAWQAMNAAPFLHKVSEDTYFIVYKVIGARPAAVSPLLTGPYLHCQTQPLHF